MSTLSKLNVFKNLFATNKLGKGVSPYAYYLDVLSQWPSAPILGSMWLVVINLQSVNALLNSPKFSNIYNSSIIHKYHFKYNPFINSLPSAYLPYSSVFNIFLFSYIIFLLIFNSFIYYVKYNNSLSFLSS